MLKENIIKSLPDDVLYTIFKFFLTDDKLSVICCVNKAFSKLINKTLMKIHLKSIIATMKNILNIKNV